MNREFLNLPKTQERCVIEIGDVRIFLRSLPKELRRVGLALLKHTGADHTHCWPGRERVAEMSNCSPRTVTRHTARLADLGAIPYFVQRAFHLGNDYWMHPELVAWYWKIREVRDRRNMARSLSKVQSGVSTPKEELHAQRSSVLQTTVSTQPRRPPTESDEELNNISQPVAKKHGVQASNVALSASPEETLCAAKLEALGMIAHVARQLVSKYGVEPCKAQAEWFPHRGTPQNPGGYLYRAIVEGYPAPVAYVSEAKQADVQAAREIANDEQLQKLAQDNALRDQARRASAYEASLTADETAAMHEKALQAAHATGKAPGTFLFDLALKTSLRRLVAARSSTIDPALSHA